MNELADFVLGLGIFFVGMQMVGEHMRQLGGPAFRSLIARFTASPGAGAALGLAAGALLQSATGVTFILVNMVDSGLVAAEAALPVVTWTNVGLTALAFVVTLDIHPLVAWSVGIAGIMANLLKHRLRKQIASVLLGIALLLFGLQTMSAAAGPLEHADAMRSTIAHAVALPPVAFFAGFLLAALVQSNTGATMLVITLASAGVMSWEPAVMVIYGTNLGAIVLRLMLSLNLRGTALQLVRFEDAFCVLSGVLMSGLYFVETMTGAPLVMALARWLSPQVATQLAVVFLLSNLLPALVITPLWGRSLALLSKYWPAAEDADAAQPKYLTARSLEDPATAVDLIPRELARLLSSLRASVQAHRAGTDSGIVEDQRAADYATLAMRIEEFAAQVALAPLQRSVVDRLNIAREMTAVVGYVAETYVQLRQSHRELRQVADTEALRDRVLASLETLLDAAAAAADTRQPAAIAALREQSRRHSQLVEETRQACVVGAVPDGAAVERAAMLKLLGDFELMTWIIHRLAKLLEQYITPVGKSSNDPPSAAGVDAD